MKIAEVEAWIFHYPLNEPFYPSWVPGYASMNCSAVIYRLTTDEGLAGVAGGVAFADEAKGAVNLLRVYLSNLDINDTDEVYSRLSAANRTIGVRAWFVEAAFWDLKGKAEGKSVNELLGGKRTSVKAYASTGSLREPEEAADLARSIVEQGFKGLKIRTRHDSQDKDIAVASAVREAVGNDVALMCDANQAWRVEAFGKGPVWDIDRAISTAKAMEELSVTWLEEPLDMYDINGYARLRKSTSTPIAGGELDGDPGLVSLLIDAGGVDVVQPDLCFTGGVTGAFALAKKASEHGLAFAPHTWSNGLGLAANLQLAAAADNCEWIEFPYDPPGWVPEGRDSMLTEPLAIDENGMLHLPKAPGLGVDLDEDRLKSFGTSL